MFSQGRRKQKVLTRTWIKNRMIDVNVVWLLNKSREVTLESCRKYKQCWAHGFLWSDELKQEWAGGAVTGGAGS